MGSNLSQASHEGVDEITPKTEIPQPVRATTRSIEENFTGNVTVKHEDVSNFSIETIITIDDDADEEINPLRECPIPQTKPVLACIAEMGTAVCQAFTSNYQMVVLPERKSKNESKYRVAKKTYQGRDRTALLRHALYHTTDRAAQYSAMLALHQMSRQDALQHAAELNMPLEAITSTVMTRALEPFTQRNVIMGSGDEYLINQQQTFGHQTVPDSRPKTILGSESKVVPESKPRTILGSEFKIVLDSKPNNDVIAISRHKLRSGRRY